jgi:hypothetical protein
MAETVRQQTVAESFRAVTPDDDGVRTPSGPPGRAAGSRCDHGLSEGDGLTMDRERALCRPVRRLVGPSREPPWTDISRSQRRPGRRALRAAPIAPLDTAALD